MASGDSIGNILGKVYLNILINYKKYFSIQMEIQSRLCKDKMEMRLQQLRIYM